MHTQSGASCTILSLHHFVTSELDPVDQGIQVRGREGRWKRVRRLGQKGHNGDTAMATNNGNNNACGVRFVSSPTNVDARTTSRVVTPKSLRAGQSAQGKVRGRMIGDASGERNDGICGGG